MLPKRPVLDFSRAAELRDRMTRWEFFVLRHRQPANLVVHFGCLWLYFGGLAGALATGRLWFLLGPPLSSLIGSPSHYIFDDGVVGFDRGEGILTRYVPIYVACIYWRLLTGEYAGDIARAEARYREVMAGLGAGDRDS